MAVQDPKKRSEIGYFDGVNNFVASNLAKKTELMHAENVRSKTVGTVEKREGQTIIGNNIAAVRNYGVFYFPISTPTGRGLYRISKVGSTVAIYYLNASSVWTALTGGGTGLIASLYIHVIEEIYAFDINVSEPFLGIIESVNNEEKVNNNLRVCIEENVTTILLTLSVDVRESITVNENITVVKL